MRFIFIYPLLLLLCVHAQGQEYMMYHEDSALIERVELSDSSAKENYLSKRLQTLQSEGYLLAKLEGSYTKDSIEHVFVSRNTAYKWLALDANSIDGSILQKAGYKERFYAQKSINIQSLNSLKQSILKVSENRGFPFAQVWLANFKDSENGISAELILNKGPLISIDTVKVIGDFETNPRYIKNYLELKESAIYSEEKIQNISLRLKESPFLKEVKSPEVFFTEESAEVRVYLEDQKANLIDGILGLLPNDLGEVVLTGDVKLNLFNSFKQGDQVLLNWRKLQDRTQDIKIYAKYPFLLNSPLGTGAKLFLYRRDTIFSSLKADFELNFRLGGNNSLKLQLGRSSSSLISTSGLANISQLPDYADVSLNFYGLGIEFEKLDYRYNPSKGYRVDISANTGQKIIQRNAAVNPEVYDSLKLRSNQFELRADLQLFVPFLKHNTFMQRMQVGWLQNEQLFQNELFRIGGIKTLRGFDIEALFASFYAVYTAEYRFLLEQNSYLFAFSDIAYYENTSLGKRIFDQPIGFGAGISFETRAGIFSFSYALGREKQNPVLLRTGKVHFGLVNYF